jgi:hypothetical protein
MKKICVTSKKTFKISFIYFHFIVFLMLSAAGWGENNKRKFFIFNANGIVYVCVYLQCQIIAKKASSSRIEVFFNKLTPADDSFGRWNWPEMAFTIFICPLDYVSYIYVCLAPIYLSISIVIRRRRRVISI